MILKNPTDEKILKQIAVLHKTNIKTGFLSSLDLNFLTCIYRTISLSKKSILLVELEQNKVQGFIAASLDLSFLKKELLKHCKKDILKLLLKLISNYKKLLKFLEVYYYVSSQKDLKLPPAELLSLVVHSNYRRKGIATNLYQELIKYMKNKNVKAFKIVVGNNLKEAQKFYERMGAKKIGEFELHKGKKSYIYLHII